MFVLMKVMMLTMAHFLCIMKIDKFLFIEQYQVSFVV